MNLPENLKKKRDELAEENANRFYHAQGGIEQTMPWSDCKESFQTGFDAACAELLPMIEKLEKALEFVEIDCGDNSCKYAKEKTGMRTNGGCRCVDGKHRLTIERHLFIQKIALAELKKWRES